MTRKRNSATFVISEEMANAIKDCVDGSHLIEITWMKVNNQRIVEYVRKV